MVHKCVALKQIGPCNAKYPPQKLRGHSRLHMDETGRWVSFLLGQAWPFFEELLLLVLVSLYVPHEKQSASKPIHLLYKNSFVKNVQNHTSGCWVQSVSDNDRPWLFDKNCLYSLYKYIYVCTVHICAHMFFRINQSDWCSLCKTIMKIYNITFVFMLVNIYISPKFDKEPHHS